MGNNGISYGKSSTSTTDIALYQAMSRTGATILSLEIEGKTSNDEDETDIKEDVADKLEAIAVRNHKMHNSRGAANSAKKSKKLTDTIENIETARRVPPVRKKMLESSSEPDVIEDESKAAVISSVANIIEPDQSEIVTDERSAELPQIRRCNVASPAPALSDALKRLQTCKKEKSATEVKKRAVAVNNISPAKT